MKFLIKEGIRPQHIAEGFKADNTLIEYKLEEWETALSLLRDYGFAEDQIVPVLYAHTELFKGKADKLYTIGETLRHIGFRDGTLHKVIVKCPELLELKSKALIDRFNLLKQTFKKVEIVRLIVESPNLFLDPISDIEDVRSYVDETMGIGHSAMAKCNIFSYSLLHLKTRHQCLQRLGRYSIPDPEGIIPNENASLKQIVDYGDKNFAKKLAMITLEEYKAFVKMMAVEVKEEKELLQYLGTDEYSESEESGSDEESP